jgi:hypothetical protein
MQEQRFPRREKVKQSKVQDGEICLNKQTIYTVPKIKIIKIFAKYLNIVGRFYRDLINNTTIMNWPSPTNIVLKIVANISTLPHSLTQL